MRARREKCSSPPCRANRYFRAAFDSSTSDPEMGIGTPASGQICAAVERVYRAFDASVEAQSVAAVAIFDTPDAFARSGLLGEALVALCPRWIGANPCAGRAGPSISPRPMFGIVLRANLSRPKPFVLASDFGEILLASLNPLGDPLAGQAEIADQFAAPSDVLYSASAERVRCTSRSSRSSRSISPSASTSVKSLRCRTRRRCPFPVRPPPRSGCSPIGSRFRSGRRPDPAGLTRKSLRGRRLNCLR